MYFLLNFKTIIIFLKHSKVPHKKLYYFIILYNFIIFKDVLLLLSGLYVHLIYTKTCTKKNAL